MNVNRCFMKIQPVLLLSGMAILGLSWFTSYRPPQQTKAVSLIGVKEDSDHSKKYKEKLIQKATAARQFTRVKNYNNNYAFLIDLSLPSGQNRFFIYDLRNDSVIKAGLVTHGNCFEYWLEGRRYSNVVGSGCSSLGKYKIGNPYTGKWGYSYKLYGLDSTNSNAYERTVVLHGHSCVSETEVADEICQSNGCPTVNPGFLESLKNIINNSGKPLLLWIYE